MLQLFAHRFSLWHVNRWLSMTWLELGWIATLLAAGGGAIVVVVIAIIGRWCCRYCGSYRCRWWLHSWIAVWNLVLTGTVWLQECVNCRVGWFVQVIAALILQPNDHCCCCTLHIDLRSEGKRVEFSHWQQTLTMIALTLVEHADSRADIRAPSVEWQFVSA